MKKFILSLDGGGVRGIVSARILNSLELKMRKYAGKDDLKLRDHFVLISGTSTGGILSLLMSSLDFNMSRILQIYMEECQKIFKNSFWHKYIGILYSSKYDSDNFRKAAERLFGNQKLSDCKINCLIPSYDIKSCRPVFFSRDNSYKYDFLLRDVAMATSSAPTYFPPKDVYDCNGFVNYKCIDGGLFANNPALCAIIETYKNFPDLKLNDLVTVSIGTGINDKKEQIDKFKKASHWGTITWLAPLIDTMLNSVADVADYQIEKLYSANGLNIDPSNNKQECNYYRFQPMFDTFVYGDIDLALDNIDPSNMGKLLEATEKYIQTKSVQDSLNRLAQELILH